MLDCRWMLTGFNAVQCAHMCTHTEKLVIWMKGSGLVFSLVMLAFDIVGRVFSFVSAQLKLEPDSGFPPV